jgi:mannose-1-phosphate guanylyltransferase
MNPDQIIPDKNNRAAIILAGGDGTRLAQLTRRVDGVHVPKQFCAVLGEIPLLNQTRRRVSLSVPAERVSFVLNKDHEHFFSPLLADVSRHNLIVQSRNRGTAPAILYSLLRLAESAPRASVLLMPSDHHVGDEAALMKYVDLAFAAVEEHQHLTVLLGLAPDEPEAAYGWIEPAATDMGQSKTLPVRRFWEKPSREIARELMAAGCLWNTFMMVGHLPTLLGLFTLAMPELYVSFSKIRPSLGTLFEEEILGRLYEDLRPSDFSRRVLESAVPSLSVLPVSNVGWTDLGEPRRVAKALGGLGGQQKQVAA